MGTSPQLSGSPPTLAALSRRRNGKLYLFVPAEDVLAHKTFTAIGASVAPLVLLHLPQWQSDQELLVGQNQKQKRSLYAKWKYHAVHAFARSRCLGI